MSSEMTDKPTALRLADEIEECVSEGRYSVGGPADCAAAELRRLHASCEDYAQHKERQDKRMIELLAQRDELLAALKELSQYVAHNGDTWVQDKARAAIAKAEPAA